MLAHHRNVFHRGRIRRRGVQAHKPAFAHHLAAGIQPQHADGIQPGGAVNGGAAHGLGGLHQHPAGHGIGGLAGGQGIVRGVPEQAQRRAGYGHQLTRLAAGGWVGRAEGVILHTHEGEVAVLQPAEQGLGFVGLGRVQCGEAGVEQLHPRQHGPPVVNGGLHVTQRVFDGLAQRRAVGIGGQAVGFHQHARHHAAAVVGVGRRVGGIGHFGDLALGIAAHAQQGVNYPVHRAPGAVDGHADRIDQKRQVGVDDLHQHAGGPGEAGGQIECAHTALASRGGQQQRMVGIGHCRQKLG